LGRRLFFDPALSGPGTRSCASCHDPQRAFSDGRIRSTSLDPRGGSVARNTPTLINTALQPAQFADERAVALEDQIIAVLGSRSEMGSSIDAATRKLGRDETYRSDFARAFRADSGIAVTPLRLRQALAAYL